MPRQPDHSDGPNTLPLPELNPLLNPVLGQNMGRWAEVYFTSPPEKREEAVLELLRELQGDDPSRENLSITSPPVMQEPFQEQGRDRASGSLAASTSQITEVAEPLVPCPTCGWSNPASHRFCGMCGQSVLEPKSVADLEIADLHVENRLVESPHIEAPYREASRQDSAQNNRPQYASVNNAYEPSPMPNEPPLFQSGNDYRADRNDDRDHYRNEDRSYDRSDAIFSYPAAPRSHRLYAGIALAIVIFALGYMAWQSMQATRRTHVEPLPPPVVATEPATPSPTPASTSNTAAPDRAPSANQQAVVPPAAAVPSADPANPGADGSTGAVRAGGATAPARQPLASPTTGKNSSAETLGGYGAEELATAQRYLDGVGQERNHAEAAVWLWKAIAKHNAIAPLLLSDLYLRGDGVAKNCDQARVLLDAAARKGAKDAAERLRHLQAFGCQ